MSQHLGVTKSGALSEDLSQKIVAQILSGLAFAHSKFIYHRDMKPENIIFDPVTGQVKIIDFGFAVYSKDKLRIFCGTPSYMSPEIVSKKDYLGNAADIWATGVILFVLLVGQVPFKSNNEKELYRKIQKGTYSFNPMSTNPDSKPIEQPKTKQISAEAKEMIKSMLIVDQSARPSAQELL